MHPIKCYLEQSYYSLYFDDIIEPIFVGKSRHKKQYGREPANIFTEPIQKPPNRPQREIMEETLRQKKVDDDAVAKYPITNALFKTIRQFCEDEEIKEFDQLENILITGGGANIS